MLLGIAFALAAGMMWGVVFVGPMLLPDYSPVLLSFGRYLAFGLIALVPGWFDRNELRRLTRSDWIEAVKLSSIGNLLYYVCLASAIQLAGVPLPTMIIGTLPVVISISANFLNHQRDGRLPWIKLLPPMAAIVLGIVCVNQVELSSQAALNHSDLSRYYLGALLAVCAVVCWTWYPIRNGNWLRDHPGRNPRAWATAQGLATLPLALAGYLLYWWWAARTGLSFEMPFGPRPAIFISLMIAMGLFASWLGTMFWNIASQRIPTALAGQLIVFETLAALTYAYLLKGRWPELLTLVGIGLVLIGVLATVRIKPVHGHGGS